MTQKDQLLTLFRDNGGTLTLGQILKSDIGYEWRARATELRRDGYIINLHRGARPSGNIYQLVEPEPNGQLTWRVA